MTEVWNMWDVKPPPVCCVKTNLNLKGITALNEVAYDALNTVRSLHHFDREAGILSRFLYKMRRIFRHDKGIKDLVKVNQCLRRYLRLDLSGVLFTFKQSLPHKFNKGITHAYLPTRQMLKWVLLRLQAFSRLFARTIELCKSAGAYIYQKLCLGWALQSTLLVFCIAARILATSKFLVAKSIEWYSSFRKSLPLLEETAEFLPGYDFPVDLKVWLGDVDVSPLRKKTFVDDIFEFIDLVKGEENEEDEVKIVSEKFLKKFLKPNEIEIVSDVEEIEEEEEKEERKAVKRPFRSSEMDEDLGVPVNDDDGELFEKPRKRMKEKGGRRTKWLKKVKKTLKKCEQYEGRIVSSSSSHADSKDYLSID